MGTATALLSAAAGAIMSKQFKFLVSFFTFKQQYVHISKDITVKGFHCCRIVYNIFFDPNVNFSFNNKEY